MVCPLLPIKPSVRAGREKRGRLRDDGPFLQPVTEGYRNKCEFIIGYGPSRETGLK